ncbi:hypothetical protein DPMN_005133 [Dreissena polymorpha]|uniref:Uncharacterized protein n=1 Tax=Dreissena polymorpha TaxID=45954 RepID=A0A9D4MPS2_DREPO|nr:hypothetical protein DPMN_005133 [Dreissena polymorpha]
MNYKQPTDSTGNSGPGGYGDNGGDGEPGGDGGDGGPGAVQAHGKCLKCYMNPSNIIAGFRKTVIFACCLEVGPANKLYPSEAFRETLPLLKIMELKSGK